MISPRTLHRLFAAEGPSHGLPLPQHKLWGLLASQLGAPRRGAQPHIKFWFLEGSTAAEPASTWLLVASADHPFLTDTTLLTLNRLSLMPQQMWHPVVIPSVKGGKWVGVRPAVAGSRAPTEAWLLVRLGAVPAGAQKGLVATATAAINQNVALARSAVEDFTAQREGFISRSQLLLKGPENAEKLAFAQWLACENFVFLGYRHYTYQHSRGKGKPTTVVQATAGSGLGILRLQTSAVAKPTPVEAEMNLHHYLREEGALILSKTPDLAPVHRASPMDYVALLERNAQGDIVAEHRWLGLLTSSAYAEGVHAIPLVRNKLNNIMNMCPWLPSSHNARILRNVLETWPRDELFLASEADLMRMAMAATHVKQNPDTLLLLRESAREQAVTAMVYVPLGRMSTRLREQLALFFLQNIGPVQEFKVELGEGELARMHFRCRWQGKPVSADDLNHHVRQLVRGWDDDVADFTRHHGAQGPGIHGAILEYATPAYRAQTRPEQAVADFAIIAQHTTPAPYPLVKVAAQGPMLSLRIYNQPGPVPLVHVVMLLESCGLQVTREEEYQLGQTCLQVLSCTPLSVVPSPAAQQALEATLAAVLAGRAEEDSLNRMALLAACQPQQLRILRAWAALLLQIDRRFDPRTTRHTLWGHPALAKDLLELFRLRHQPGINRKGAKEIHARLEKAVSAQPSAEAERLWRTLLGVVLATVRTNAFQAAVAEGTEALALKLDAAKVPHLPEPKPWREIFVYHHTVEGVHLRGGPIARGGLRYSNRSADYRTEVLGLMSAQMRKNTIIVPVGAKGGFVLRGHQPAERGQARYAVEQAYRMYIRALLSITDTYNPQQQVVHPHAIICHDDADPYLVVAADKGTATFSDTANAEAIAARYWGPAIAGFWLSDAFASGGSKGYDHKAMGITAKGAWISVMHHAAKRGILPTAKRPLTMVGIGDMAGDVFGNGLLLSPHVKLVAAFNHSHIMLDPSPTPASSFAARQQAFQQGLAWDTYPTRSLSEGGGIWPRTAKSIPLSAAAQKVLGVKAKALTPDELIQAILAAPVDVLWNGGIGTYIKATDEPHAAAQDKANDTTRINAKQARMKIIGEGGNLGLTPRARVELARLGVALNTDALDNSAGVDTSDHEVNVKILLAQAQRKGQLTEAGRVALLKKLTPDIAELVLRDNRQQNLLISLEAEAPREDHAELALWQEVLVKHGYADMAVDCLPSRRDLMAREGGTYTRPELCALVAASKSWLREALLADPDLLASAAAAPLLQWYFPAAVQQQFGGLLAQHPLAQHIIATVLANLLINRLGLLAIPRLMNDYEADATTAARALALGCCLGRLTGLWRQLAEAEEITEQPLPSATVVAVSTRLKLVAGVLGAWVLQQGQPVNIDYIWKQLFAPIAEALEHLPVVLKGRPEMAAWVAEWQEMGLKKPFAQRMALLSPLVVVPDAVVAAHHAKQPLTRVLAVHLEVGKALQLPALVSKIRTMPAADSFTRQAIQAMAMDLFTRQRRLTQHVLREKKGVAAWQAECGTTCGRYHLLVKKLLREKQLTTPMLSILLSRLQELEGRG